MFGIYRTEGGYQSTMRDYLAVAVEAVRLGGDILKKSYGRVKEIKFKGDIDIVTDVDKKSEQEIVDLLSSQFPQHAILAEEGTVRDKNSDFKWVIDPLDGTTNYAHGYPVFCVSIALERNKDIIIGAVYQPMHDELFVAEKGGGAFRNGKKIQVSKISKVKQALIATGFPPDVVAEPEAALDVFGNLVRNAQSIRRDGSAALNLCSVAMGHFDGFWELHLKPWDIAAGTLVVEEAGGVVTDFQTSEYSIYQPQTLASNGLIHEEMRQMIG